MSTAFRDGLEYPDLSTCQMRLVGSGATSRPPVQLPSNILKAVSSQPFGDGGASLDDLALGMSSICFMYMGHDFVSFAIRQRPNVSLADATVPLILFLLALAASQIQPTIIISF